MSKLGIYLILYNFFLLFLFYRGQCDFWAVKSQNFPPEKHPNVLLPELTLREELGLMALDFILIGLLTFLSLTSLITTLKLWKLPPPLFLRLYRQESV